MRRRTHRQQSTRCSCMGGPDQAKEHAKPGKTAADHGDPFAHTGSCHHSELQLTTAPRSPGATVDRLRLQ